MAQKLLRSDEVSAFCGDASLLLKSGIPLYEGLAGLYGELPESSALRRATEAAAGSVRSGGKLCDAMLATGVFPAYAVDMTRIGERSGRLDDTLDGLSDYYDRQHTFERQLRSAVTYPVILILMTTAVIAVLLFAVLPVFSDVLSQFDSAAAASSRAITNVSTAVCGAALIIMVLLLVLCAAGFAMSRTQKGSARLSRILSRSPLFKKTSETVACGRFVYAMSAMLKSGMAVDESAAMARPMTDNAALLSKLDRLEDAMSRKLPQDEAFAESGLFSGMDNRAVRLACRTGTLDAAFSQLSSRYERLISERLDAVASTVEPALVAALTVIIGAIMLSAMLPLIQIMSSIG